MGALMTIASLGLRLEGPLGQAYLQERWVWDEKKGNKDNWKGHYECQAGIGYRGFMAIARRDPQVRDIEATIVYQADEFEFQRGTEMWLRHVPNLKLDAESRGEMAAVYAGVRYKDGYYTFDVYPIADVIALRDRILEQTYHEIERHETEGEVFWRTYQNGDRKRVDPSAPGCPPWIGHPIPMIQKTAVRWAAKYWNLTPEMDRAAQLIALDDAGQSQELAQAALGSMPDHVRHAAEQETGIAAEAGRQAQVASVRTGNALKSRMAAEAAASTGASEPALPAAEDEDQRPPQEPEDEPQAEPTQDDADMSDEDKQAALALEKEEAAKAEHGE